MAYQRKSEIPRGDPEPESHKQAVQKVIRALAPDGWIAEEKSTLRVVMHWTNSNDVSNFRFFNNNYVHEYDVSFTKTHSNGLKSHMIVEIDGLGTRHEKPYQVNRDKTAQDFAKLTTFDTYRDVLNVVKECVPDLYMDIMTVMAEKHAKFSMPDVYFIRMDKNDINEAWSEIEILNKIKKKIKEHFI